MTEPLDIANPRLRVLEALTVAITIRDVVRLQDHLDMARRRTQRTTWRQIGSVFDLSRQSAQQRFRQPPCRITPEAWQIQTDDTRHDLRIAVRVALKRIDGRAAHLDEANFLLDLVVAEARLRGCSWSAIGASLACTRQSAHEKYRRRVEHVLSDTAYLNRERFWAAQRATTILHSRDSTPAERTQAQQVYLLFRS